MKYKVPFIKPTFPSSADIADDYEEIVKSNWFTNFGSFEKRFREDLSRYIGGGVYVCTAANATLALDVAITALFKKNKRKVLTQSFTFAAASERLIANNYTPVLLDVNEDMQPDINQAKQYLKDNARSVAGILICNTFGVGNPEIGDWEELAKKYKLPLIIDSAAGLGSEYSQGERIGRRGDCEIFSFHATKPFGIGEGGAITSKDEELISAMRNLTNFGFNQNREIESIGTNAKLNEISAAIGCRQMLTFPKRLKNRQDTLMKYKKYLKGTGYSFQVNDELSSVPFASIVAVDEISSKEARDKLIQAGVEVRNYYAPLHKEKMLVKYCDTPYDLTNTESFATKIMSVPVHDNMNAKDVDLIIKTLI